MDDLNKRKRPQRRNAGLARSATFLTTACGSLSFRSLRFSRSGGGLDLGIIGAVWLCWLASLFVLQLLGYPYGFDVWPLGEDRNWVDILQRGAGTSAASLFWSINDRNPMSPWWYIAFRDFILQIEPALLILRYLVGLALALSTYILIVDISGRQSRAFALGIALGVVLFMANGYFDQIYWNFEAALVLSVVSVSCYAKFLNSRRVSYGWYALSLVCWLTAIASYSIQCGAVLGVYYLALTRDRDPDRKLGTLPARSLVALGDVLPYGAFFGVFLLVWRTTMLHPGTYDLGPSLQKFVASLQFGAWHYDLQLWLQTLFQSPAGAPLAVGAIFALLMFVVLNWRSDSKSAEQPGTLRAVLDVLVVVALLSVPTILVETGGGAWTPGSRWRMIYQLTTPAFYLSVVALLVGAFAPRYRRGIWAAAVAGFCGCAVVSSLMANTLQVRITASEKRVKIALEDVLAQKLFAGSAPPFYFLLVGRPGFFWYSSDLLSDVYAKTWFPGANVTFRFVPKYPIESPLADQWPIRFGSDADGVGNAILWGRSVPYAQTDVLDLSPTTIRRRTHLGKSDISGYQAIWARGEDVTFAPLSGMQCPISWSADRSAMLSGWGEAESDAKGPFRWTTSRSAEIDLPVDCSAPARLKVLIAYAVTERNLAAVRFLVNGREIPIRRAGTADGVLYSGDVPVGVLDRSHANSVVIRVPETDRVGQAPRELGVAVRRIEIEPATSP
jgi:hypothetical protein